MRVYALRTQASNRSAEEVVRFLLYDGPNTTDLNLWHNNSNVQFVIPNPDTTRKFQPVSILATRLHQITPKQAIGTNS
jgi:hypothetical protein